MKVAKLVLAAYISAIVFAALATSARAHSFKAPKRMSLDKRATFQKKILDHDRHVLRWHRRTRPLTRPTCTFPEEPGPACLTERERERISNNRTFHRAQARWTARNLRATLHAIVARADASWSRALDYVSDVFPAERPWVQACSSSEGASPDGLRAARLTMNREGSGAGGPMQFMSGTFYGNVDAAAAETRRRGHRFLPAWRRWSSYAGQALTAANMKRRGQQGQWTGARC